jgi:hypothetical protein
MDAARVYNGCGHEFILTSTLYYRASRAIPNKWLDIVALSHAVMPAGSAIEAVSLLCRQSGGAC